MNNQKTAPASAAEAKEGLFELSDADLKAVHGGIVIGSKYTPDQVQVVRLPGTGVRIPGITP